MLCLIVNILVVANVARDMSVILDMPSGLKYKQTESSLNMSVQLKFLDNFFSVSHTIRINSTRIVFCMFVPLINKSPLYCILRPNKFCMK